MKKLILNFKSKDSKKIKKTSDISSITVEDVLKTAEQHLNF